MRTKRRVGATGPEVSAIGLGCMGMSFAYGGADDAESTRTLHRALDLGINHLDTADMYGFGANGGLLTGAITSREQLADDDWRRTVPRFAEGNLDANLTLVDAVREVAAEIGCTPAQAALAWVLAEGEDVLAIPGTKRVRYLEENVAAADVRLSPQQRSRLREAVPAGAVAGERYTEAGMRTVGH